ncbi:MAG: EamA family transporter [Hyphomicrobiaceae bacterium]
MWKPLAFAMFAAVGNALFVWAQRGAGKTENPFLFTFGAVIACAVLFIPATYLYRTPGDAGYLLEHSFKIWAGGLGFFITFVGFFFLYTGYGASSYVLYATCAILTTTFVVGVLIYREPFNVYQAVAVLFAIAAIALYTYGRTKD